MPAQLNIFLLLFGVLQGLFLAFFFIKKRLYRSGYTFLLFYFGVMLLQVLLKVMNKLWLMENLGFLYSVSYFLPLLYGPLIFLLVRQLVAGKSWKPADLLHFLPFGFLFTCLFLERQLGFSYQPMHFLFRTDTGMFLQLISLLAYHGLSLRYWARHRKAVKTFDSAAHQLRFTWLRQLIIASLLVCSIIALALHLVYINHPQSLPWRYGFAALTIFIYWVSYTALMQPTVFAVIKGNDEHATAPVLPKLVVHRPARKYVNSGLSKKDIAAIQTTLKQVTEEQKPYLDPGLTINDLAALVKCNRHHLSQVMNESLECSFYEYINQYRVEEAKQLLMLPGKENYKIASIAYDAGFNSLSTFNEIFRKRTGITPSQFRKELQQLSRHRRG